MLAGTLSVPPRDRAHVVVEPERAAAIGLAIEGAAKGDVIVIAGKGHERGQYVGDKVIPFDDREVAARALADRVRTERAAAALARAELTRPDDDLDGAEHDVDGPEHRR
jgi:UDP-N-acetylmuramoyl-L-alanyl-D-glutamate--2,6-diaminopimelate ligase